MYRFRSYPRPYFQNNPQGHILEGFDPQTPGFGVKTTYVYSIQNLLEKVLIRVHIYVSKENTVLTYLISSTTTVTVKLRNMTNMIHLHFTDSRGKELEQ